MIEVTVDSDPKIKLLMYYLQRLPKYAVCIVTTSGTQYVTSHLSVLQDIGNFSDH